MIKELVVFNPKLPKIRLGYPWDGGYVMAIQSLCRSEALFSYGVGTDVSLETDYVEATNKQAYSFDHTIDSIQAEERVKKNINFIKEGLSAFKTDQTDNFLSHYQKWLENQPHWKRETSSNRVLFKCDIEGNEYDYLLNTDIKKLSEITTGLLFEFHSLKDDLTREKFFQCLKEINKYFYLCHFHGNNYSDNFNYFEERFSEELNKNYIEKFSIPDAVELSFVNKDIVNVAYRDNRKYPCEFLDRKNNPSKEDSDLSFLQKI
jgi:hypothetical protein